MPQTTATGTVQGADKTIRPFQFIFSDADLADLRRRVNATRWPERELVNDASQGVQLATMQTEIVGMREVKFPVSAKGRDRNPAVDLVRSASRGGKRAARQTFAQGRVPLHSEVHPRRAQPIWFAPPDNHRDR